MPDDGEDFERVNTEGPSNLLEVAKETGVKTIVHLSTVDVYGFRAGTVDAQTATRPSDAYQRSKVLAEDVLLHFAKKYPQPRVVVIRAARAVGSRDNTLVVPLLRMIASRRVVLPRGSEMSFSHPKDIAQAMYKAATNGALPGGIYLVKSFDATPERIALELAGSIGAPVDIVKAGILSKPGLSQYTTRQLAASLKVLPQSSWNAMGYSPAYDLGKTCEEITSWYKKEPWITEPA